MGDVRGDLRVAFGCRQGQGRVNRVIEGMNNIMGRARMVRVFAKHLLGYRTRFHPYPKR